VPWLQLALGFCALFRRTLPAVGLGIFGLFGLAIRNYGLFHLLDYLIFVGLGYFFVVATIKLGKWRQSGFVVLFAATGITLLWAAMEKFAYPEWSYAMLRSHPDMLMGLQPETFMVLAGFVEFSVAFVLGNLRVWAARRDWSSDDHCDLVCALHARADERTRDPGAARKIGRDGNVFHDGFVFPGFRNDLHRLLRSAFRSSPRIV